MRVNSHYKLLFVFPLSNGGCGGVCILHLCIHRHLLSEDTPQHAGAGHRESDYSPAAQRNCPLDTGQDQDGSTRSFLLCGERLQRVVLVRDRVPVPGESEKDGVHDGPHQHHRFHRHHVLLLGHAAAETRL
ncbi:hypothetical protein TNIN_427331 [Trichonephila inaurata madagascariensis]|uniref:Uncharacterized protein n=1 Tax=Trichonephila inaurata madagascariensis TaxID=2747483 RepID=A0A8X6WX27_9ARAC|nr:hypothetical protein TNIN_427331 [Trichonephila inaurata madagascariensis]